MNIMKKQDKRKLSLDIQDWCHEVDDTDLVVFERFTATHERSDTLDDTQEEEDVNIPDIQGQSLAVYNTPFGIVKMPEFSDINKHFKLWTMYTRYPITNQLRDTVDKTNGVETFEIFTPYRARIGICPLYKDGQVLEVIQKTIQDLNPVENEKI